MRGFFSNTGFGLWDCRISSRLGGNRPYCNQEGPYTLRVPLSVLLRVKGSIGFRSVKAEAQVVQASCLWVVPAFTRLKVSFGCLRFMAWGL